ncbi:MAG TPA: peptidyl-tRNA hydrolase [Thermoplasmata archaeon]|nr:peptidyl-tRNA hydrolase [Thermoplasmata archaeon]
MQREFNYKLVVVVRQDLKLSKGKLAVQVAHAAVACALKAKKKCPLIFSKWWGEGQKKAVVKVKTEKEIYQLEEKAQSLRLVTAIIRDAGLTEIPPNTLTCLGIGPAKTREVDKITGELSLL